MTRRYRITHRTVYTYGDVVTGSYGRGFLTPRDTDGQRCRHHELLIDPAPADQSQSRDGYGNLSSYFHVTATHRMLTVTGWSLVDVDPPPALGADASAQAWELARPRGAAGARAAEFALDLPDPEITDTVRAYAAPTFGAGRPLGEVVGELCSRIHTDFTYRSGSTSVSTRVAEVLRDRHGVCQDFARLAIACLRANGLAAGYVSGYLATDPPPGRERMVGVDATHAWPAVWVPGGRWLGFDPTNDALVDERYVTVGWGRDYADVPPLRGIIYTESERSTIEVSVDVAPVEGLPDHA